MKKQILAIVRRHNSVVDTLSGLDIPVPANRFFAGMELWHSLACEGYEIAKAANECGWKATCDMQSGRVTVQLSMVDAYEAAGAPRDIYHGEYKGRLVNIQPLTDGLMCGIYRFPGGDCIGGPTLHYNEVTKVLRGCV